MTNRERENTLRDLIEITARTSFCWYDRSTVKSAIELIELQNKEIEQLKRQAESCVQALIGEGVA